MINLIKITPILRLHILFSITMKSKMGGLDYVFNFAGLIESLTHFFLLLKNIT